MRQLKNVPECIKFLYQAGGNVHARHCNEDQRGRGQPWLVTAVKLNSNKAVLFLLSYTIRCPLCQRDKNGLP